jgi:NAD-dependent dihydropyrimidine dehydrogenase PreA subunit
MCEFCIKHGDGKIWYLEAKNYSLDLISDLRRRKWIEKFITDLENNMVKLGILDRLKQRSSILYGLAKRLFTNKLKKVHFGQVVPLEDAREIFKITNTIVRIPCACRKAAKGKEVRACFGFSAEPNSLFGYPLEECWPDYSEGPEVRQVEKVDREQAVEMLSELEEKGVIHTIWTFKTPLIAALCNCDRQDCMAFRTEMTLGAKVMFRAEYYASVDWDKCKGCKNCLTQCGFGALRYSLGQGRCSVDITRCYGCGICRITCPEGAITLRPRKEHPVLNKVW